MNILFATLMMFCSPDDYPQILHMDDIQGYDSLPVCTVEDCSDQVGQVGLWEDKDTGNWYYSAGECASYLVIDETRN